jgi:hypothetical protein
MNGLQDGIVRAALVVVLGLTHIVVARAQTTSAHAMISGSTTTAGSPAVSSLSTGSGMGVSSTSSTAATASSAAYGMGMPMMALALPFSAASASGSNAADDLTGLPSRNSAPSNIFANPYAAPLIYNSMMPGLGNSLAAQGQTASAASSMGGSMNPMSLGATQMGLMMLATQRPMGIGSGQLGGARSAPGADPRSSRGQQATTAREAHGQVRTPPPPGGLAARYFNRTTARSPYPQKYYNRQSRYFP